MRIVRLRRRHNTVAVTEIDYLVDLATSTRKLIERGVRRYITRSQMNEAEHRELVARLLEVAPADSIPHPALRVIERHKMSVRRGLSFHQIMLQRSEARHAGVHDRGWLLDDKPRGYKFADQLKVRRPVTDLKPRPLAEVKLTPPTVLKPVRSTGGRGVFLVFSHDRVMSVRDKGEVITLPEALARAQDAMQGERPVRDRWITEELIVDRDEPARDLKFYAFYPGRIAFVQEIQRIPTFTAAYWTPEGKRITTGKRDGLVDPYGVTQRQYALAEKISAAIPAPFMRIDMLRTGDDAVLGEFTPRPGQFEEFDDATDRWLAEEWVRSERQLLDDALAGKRFRDFERATAR